ncbi:MAG TPA: cellulase family glycosylhydrolase [Conexibacter sp.]
MRQRILLVVMTGLALLVPSAVASASSTQYTTVEAPSELLNGSPARALDQITSLGATAIRITMPWREIAPDPDSRTAPSFNATDPNAYPAAGWAGFDAAINGARQRHLKVQLTITGPAPDWATPSKHDGLTRPDPTAFGKFATAVARRYGSKIGVWSIWNEPNLGKLLKPIASNASATVYRNLYLKAYEGLRNAGVRAPVLIGELAPIGNSLKDQGTIRPLAFLRATLCLDRNDRRLKGTHCAKVPTQGLALHPYATRAGPFLQPPADDVTIGVLSRATSALDKAAKAGAIPAHLPLYVTEFGVQSLPDQILGVPLAVQSDYRSLAEYIAFKNPRVKAFSQYLLRDDAGTGREHGAFESGLFLNKGDKAKPALEGFRLPLVVLASRNPSRVTLWGLVRPARAAHHSGSLTIQYADKGKSFKQLATQRYSSSGYWKRVVSTKKGRAFRVVWKAPDGTTHTGPKTLLRTGP